ncbi:MAG: hypothetical protein ACYTBZ_24390, partial [Planctomycetota bacterium]
MGNAKTVRDWQKKPYTWEEYRNYILTESQLAGDWPFVELDINDLPAEGTSLPTIFGRKVYGNIVDGFPGVGQEITATGALHYKSKGWEEGTLYDLFEQLRVYHNAEFGDLTTAYLHDYNAEGSPSRYTLLKAQKTLAGGVLNNSQILAAPGAGSWSIPWMIASWDVDPAAQYSITLHDNGAGAIAPVMYFPPSFRGNRKVWCYIDSASATTAMEV